MTLQSDGEKFPTGSQGQTALLLIDSGPNTHMTPYRDELVNLETMDQTFAFGDQGHLVAKAVRDMQLLISHGDNKIQRTIMLKNMYCGYQGYLA